MGCVCVWGGGGGGGSATSGKRQPGTACVMFRHYNTPVMWHVRTPASWNRFLLLGLCLFLFFKSPSEDSNLL